MSETMSGSGGARNHRVTFVVPSIPPRARNGLLKRAITSIEGQTYPVWDIIVEVDEDKDGPAVVRNRGLAKVKSGWVAFLDDDDTIDSDHLEKLVSHQKETRADVVWPWFRVVGGGDPFPMHFGRQWDPARPHSFPITTLVRTRLAKAVGGFPEGVITEDLWFWHRLNDAGARFAHLAERTWTYYHNTANTSGLPSRWK